MSEAKKPEETQTPAPAATQPAKDKPAETAGAAAPAENADGLPKTQEELDALIEKRLARERRKAAAKPAAQPATPPDAGDPAPNNGAAQPAAAAPDTATAQLTRDLLIANAKLQAFRSDLSDSAVDDAVELAVIAAEKDGDLSAEGVADALKDVLKRHPEWKKSGQDKGGKTSGGFQVGAEAQLGTPPASVSKNKVPTHPWNRFNHNL